MPFQKEIQSEMCPGLPGTSAGAEPAIAVTRRAGAEITLGRAVWAGVGDADTVMPSGTGDIAGIASVSKTGVIAGHLQEAVFTVQTGEPVAIIERGVLFAVLTGDAEAGQAVYASTSNGTLKAAAAGATVPGHVATKFTVRRGGTTGAVITITSW